MDSVHKGLRITEIPPDALGKRIQQIQIHEFIGVRYVEELQVCLPQHITKVLRDPRPMPGLHYENDVRPQQFFSAEVTR